MFAIIAEISGRNELQAREGIDTPLQCLSPAKKYKNLSMDHRTVAWNNCGYDIYLFRLPKLWRRSDGSERITGIDRYDRACGGIDFIYRIQQRKTGQSQKKDLQEHQRGRGAKEEQKEKPKEKRKACYGAGIF